MSSYTRQLTDAEQQTARDRAVEAAHLGYNHAPEIHYSQDMVKRWYPIAQHCDASKGEYADYADCSAYVTWCIWNAVYLPHGLEDIVNGQQWQAGYTGTMLGHGAVVSTSDAIAGDAVIYGSGGTGQHTAIVVGRDDGQLMVVSHGSEGGPYYVAYNYRTDIMCIRRYIDGKPHQSSAGPITPEETAMIAPVVKKNGAIVIFAQKENGAVMHAYQKNENGGWAGAEEGVTNAKWYALGNPGK